MVVSSATIDSLLKEKEQYAPPKEFTARALVKDDSIYREAGKDFEAFWAHEADSLHWVKTWDKVRDWQAPFAKWFPGGQINVSENCLDRHLTDGRRNKAALVWKGEPGDTKVYTYHQLWREVNKFANVLRGLGVKRGDRVTIYMPMIPELPIAMLACARIGAIHSVIFGGFSSKAVHDRVLDAESPVVVTADYGYRRGGVVRLKKAVDEGIADLSIEKHVVVFKRATGDSAKKEGRDQRWPALMATAAAPVSSTTSALTPGYGNEADPGFRVLIPGRGVMRIMPVSVCHHVSTTGQRLPPIVR